MAKYSDRFFHALAQSRVGQIGKAVDDLLESAAKPGEEGFAAKAVLQFLYATHALRSENAAQKDQLKRVRAVLGDNPVVDLMVADGYQKGTIETVDDRPRIVMTRGADKHFVPFITPKEQAGENVAQLKPTGS